MTNTTYHVGIEATMAVLSGKWKPVLLCLIQSGNNRNGSLLRALPDVSQKVLTEQLRQLVSDGILERIDYNEKPARVEYHVTEYGSSLTKILMSLCHWGEQDIRRKQAAGMPVSLGTAL